MEISEQLQREKKEKIYEAADVDQNELKSTKEKIFNLPVMVRQ